MIVCVIGIAMLLIEYSASHIDFGPMPTPEQAMADLQKDYTDLEFIAVVHSEDNEHVYDGGRLPAGWIGYKFRFKWDTNLSNSDTITLYPCLYKHTSHEWSGGMISHLTRASPDGIMCLPTCYLCTMTDAINKLVIRQTHGALA